MIKHSLTPLTILFVLTLTITGVFAQTAKKPAGIVYTSRSRSYVVRSDATYTNNVLGFSAKFRNLKSMKYKPENMMSDYSLFVDTESGSSIWFSGIAPEFRCDSAESCASVFLSIGEGIDGYEKIGIDDDISVAAEPAYRITYKTNYGSGGEKQILDEVHVFRDIRGKAYSYRFSLQSFPSVYEKDKLEFEEALETIKFITPRR